jgi:flagellar hook-associated protein 3 FlgL
MRITSFMIFDQLKRSIERNLGRVSELNGSLSSGKRIGKPSDDVIGMMRAMDYRLSIDSNDRFKRNIDEAKAHLGFTEGVLSSVSEALIRAKELALTGSSGTQDSESRMAIAKEISELRDHLISLANSKLRERYVFSGFKTDTQPFNPNTLAYQGDSGMINVMIDKGTLIPINVLGTDAFRYVLTADDTVSLDNGKYIVYSQAGASIQVEIYDSNGTPSDPSDDTLLESFGFSNFMEMLDHLGSALEGNDSLKVQALLKPLDLALGQVTNLNSEIGARLSRLDDQTSRLEKSTVDFKTLLSGTEDADIVEVVSELSKTQTALQALRQSSAEFLSQSLFDFLR